MIKISSFIRALCACTLLVVSGCAAQTVGKPQYLPRTPMVIETAKGNYHFEIEVAVTARQHEKGLMYRPKLAENAGMLFVYPKPGEMEFWMKNTPEPLDILFINADGHIRKIAPDNQPFSLKTIPSNGPVIAALELRGGRAAEIGLKKGDLVRHAWFHNLAAAQ